MARTMHYFDSFEPLNFLDRQCATIFSLNNLALTDNVLEQKLHVIIPKSILEDHNRYHMRHVYDIACYLEIIPHHTCLQLSPYVVLDASVTFQAFDHFGLREGHHCLRWALSRRGTL